MAKPRKRMESASVMDNPAQNPEPQEPSAAPGDAGADPRDRIAVRAYELYRARGGQDGGDFDDWLAAEREIGHHRSSEEDAGE
jgi:hypothetical protein